MKPPSASRDIYDIPRTEPHTIHSNVQSKPEVHYVSAGYAATGLLQPHDSTPVPIAPTRAPTNLLTESLAHMRLPEAHHVAAPPPTANAHGGGGGDHHGGGGGDHHGGGFASHDNGIWTTTNFEHHNSGIWANPQADLAADAAEPSRDDVTPSSWIAIGRCSYLPSY